ncbi:MAG: GNAT family N-acetyltransferase [Hyphomicrobiaceae bacterium]
MSLPTIETLERAAARAWPALCTEDVDGWQWRGSGGGARRANSVLPIGYHGQDLDAAIERVEKLYRAQNTRSYFQVSSASSPDNLDQRLAERGYVLEEPCLLMAKPLIATPMPAGVSISTEPSDAWLSIYTEPLDASRRAIAPATLAAAPDPKAFILVSRDGEPLASALGVYEPATGIVLVECVATRSDQRRSGGAQLVMDALESWGAAQSAKTAALQVTTKNTAARALYEKRRYTVVGHYHYRWRDVN